jgi:hypothetical protein
MIGTLTRLACGVGGLLLAAWPLSPATAHGHGGGHGGFHGGHFHGHGGVAVGFGFGFGCCWGGPFGYYPPYYYAGYPYPAYPAYAQPVSYVSQASAPAYASGAAAPTGGGDCREYQTQIMIGGQPQIAVGLACRQPDGTWRLAGH